MVGVPERTPVFESVSPGGRLLPAPRSQEMGVVPPDAISWAVYATPTAASASETVEMRSGEEDDELMMVMDKVAVAEAGVEPESVTATTKEELPATVGVPEIVPVGDSDRPAGSVPLETLQPYGAVPPDASRST